MCECKYAAIRGAHDKITQWQPIMYAQCFHKTGRIEEVHWPWYLAYLCLNSVFELDSGTRQDSKLGVRVREESETNKVVEFGV